MLPDGTEVGFGAVRADEQFAEIFRGSLRAEPTAEELAIVDSYSVNIFLAGPGGSLPRARKMMEAAAAIIHAGGAGVFIDNCGLAHGGQNWLMMTDDGSPDALSFAYVGIVRGKKEVWTMGMHVLGLHDLVMSRADADADERTIIEVIRYLAEGEKPMEDGHVIIDLNGPRFQAFAAPSPDDLAGSPMHNPFGRLRLVSVRDVAENN